MNGVIIGVKNHRTIWQIIFEQFRKRGRMHKIRNVPGIYSKMSKNKVLEFRRQNI